MNIYKIYNLFSINHNKILLYNNLSIIKQTLHIKNKSVIIEILIFIIFINKVFIFKIIFINKQFIKFYPQYRYHFNVISKK